MRTTPCLGFNTTNPFLEKMQSLPCLTVHQYMQWTGLLKWQYEKVGDPFARKYFLACMTFWVGESELDYSQSVSWSNEQGMRSADDATANIEQMAIGNVFMIRHIGVAGQDEANTPYFVVQKLFGFPLQCWSLAWNFLTEKVRYLQSTFYILHHIDILSFYGFNPSQRVTHSS